MRRREYMIICKATGRTPVLAKTIELRGVTGHGIKVLGQTQLDEIKLGPVTVIIVEDIGHAMIVGRDLLCLDQATIDYTTGLLTLRGQQLSLLPARHTDALHSLGDRPPIVNESRIAECVHRNQELFAAKGEPLGCHPDIQVRIHTDGPPIKRRPYRLPLSKRQALEKKMEELIEQGVIVPSSSPWSSPVVLVEKKDNSDGPRFCVDYTALNKITIKDAYPIPLIRDIFDQLHGAVIFSTLDLKSGFHQLPVHPDDQHKTAFNSHLGLFQWTRMPMGLCNSSQMFQRAMEVVFKGLIGKTCMLYIDDIVVYSKSEEEHVQHLEQMFARLREYNLRLNPSKCSFGLKRVKLLGYIVSQDGLSADPDKVSAIARMTAPKSVAEIRSFLGMTGYYRSCIKDYAHISEPLVSLTRKNMRFTWSAEHQKAFDSLKQSLVCDMVMAHPQTDKPYLLYTDACDYAIGGILCQLDDNGVERPIVYLSKQLSDTQRRWATIEKEAYAVIYALKQLRPYLYGASFRTFTDHKPLTSLFTKEMNNTKIQRWSVLLAEYGCKVEYHKGKLNVRADMLSRIRQKEEVATFDVGYWQLGDKLPQLPEDLTATDIYGLDIPEIARQQKDMTEWTEQHDQDSHYEVINELLYTTKRPYQYAADHPRLIIPPAWRPHIMKQAHIDVGHMSVIKTMRKIQEAFIWQGMRADITSFIAKCPTCLVHSRIQPRAPMGEMPIATAPMQIVGADLIGPLVKSPHENCYILTIIDHCTGWGQAYPIPAKSSYHVWRKFTTQFFPMHGYPDVLITDQGLEFGALELRRYLQDVGIEQRRTTSYNPQANGKCERFNGTLKQIIARLINNTRDNWEDQLGPALLAYNNSVSDSTGHTPFFLNYGRRARIPISKFLKDNAGLDYRLQHVADALRTARQVTEKSRHYNRQRLARQANAGRITEGDTVIIKAAEPLSLTSTWDPQWTVTKVRDKVIWLTHQQTGKQKVLNRNKVKLVDPNIVWDELNPRPIRNPRKSTKLTGLAPRAIRQDHAAQEPTPSTSKAATKVKPTMKRRRHESHSSEEEETTTARHTKTATRKGTSVEPQPSTSQHQQDPPESPVTTTEQHSSRKRAAVDCKTSAAVGKRQHRQAPRRPHEQDDTPQDNKRPLFKGVRRPHEDDSQDIRKRLHRHAPRRLHDPEPEVNPKRTRPTLPRGAKRTLPPDITPPTPEQQKKAKVAVIATLVSLLKC